jgi:hypothetical protein
MMLVNPKSNARAVGVSKGLSPELCKTGGQSRIKSARAGAVKAIYRTLQYPRVPCRYGIAGEKGFNGVIATDEDRLAQMAMGVLTLSVAIGLYLWQ